MTDTYSPQQVLDALKRQGFSDEQAMGMYQAMGGMRRSSPQIQAGYGAVGARGARLPEGDDGEQDSGLLPNLSEGVAATLAFNKLNKHIPHVPGAPWYGKNFARGAGRLMGAGLAGNLATLGTVALTDNNFYDTATAPQLLADVGGSFAGGIAGQLAGDRAAAGIGALEKGTKNVLTAAVKRGAASVPGTGIRAATSRLAGTAASKLLGAAAGRGIGGLLGSVVPGAGTVIGSALGGWLLPKLFEKGTTSVDEDIMNDVIKRKKSVYGEHS